MTTFWLSRNVTFWLSRNVTFLTVEKSHFFDFSDSAEPSTDRLSPLQTGKPEIDDFSVKTRKLTTFRWNPEIDDFLAEIPKMTTFWQKGLKNKGKTSTDRARTHTTVQYHWSTVPVYPITPGTTIPTRLHAEAGSTLSAGRPQFTRLHSDTVVDPTYRTV